MFIMFQDEVYRGTSGVFTNVTQLAEGGFGLIYLADDQFGNKCILKKCSISISENFQMVQKEVKIF